MRRLHIVVWQLLLILWIVTPLAHAGVDPDPLVPQAGPNWTIEPADEVIIKGSASGGVQPYSYSWQKISGPGSITAQGAHVIYRNDPAQTGSVSLRLTVTDANGTVVSDYTVLTVTDCHPPNLSPIHTVKSGVNTRCFTVQAATTSDGSTRWVAYLAYPPGDADAEIFVRVNSGSGWSEYQLTSNGYYDYAPTIALNPADGNKPWVIWYRYVNSQYVLLLRKYTGSGWRSETQLFSMPTTTAPNPRLRISSNGKAWLIWNAYNSSFNRYDIMAASCQSGSWSEATRISRTNRCYNPDLALDCNDQPWVAWESYETYNGVYVYHLYYSTYADAMWSWPERLTNLPNYYYNRYPCIAIDAQNRKWIAHQRNTSPFTIVLQKIDDQGVSPDILPPSSASSRTRPAITIDEKNRVMVGWLGNPGLYLNAYTDGQWLASSFPIITSTGTHANLAFGTTRSKNLYFYYTHILNDYKSAQLKEKLYCQELALSSAAGEPGISYIRSISVQPFRADPAVTTLMWLDGDVESGSNTRQWITFCDSVDVTLTPLDGSKDITLRLRDSVGNQSWTVSDQITLNTPSSCVLDPLPAGSDDEISGSISLSFTLYDEGTDPITIVPQYSTNGSDFVTMQSLTGSTTNLASSNAGEAHTITWHSDTDLAGQDIEQLWIRITPYDPDPGTASQIGPYHLDNNAPPSATILSSGKLGGLALIEYSLEDAESDAVSIQVEYSADGGSTYQPAIRAGNQGEGTTGLSSSPSPGTSHTFAWDAKQQLGIGEFTNISVHISTADNDPGTPATKSLNVDALPPVFNGLLMLTTINNYTQVRLSWHAAQNFADTTTYQIYRAQSSGAQDLDAPPFATSSECEIILTKESTPYYYLVRASDSLGNQDSNWRELPDDMDIDSDDDGLTDAVERELTGTHPMIPDTDSDELLDGFEATYEFNLDYIQALNPLNPDTNQNGSIDAVEDFDQDQLLNWMEQEYQTNPYRADTDDDGLTDYEEIFTYGTDPTNPDTDGDGILDSDDTSPATEDQDGDTLSNTFECTYQMLYEGDNTTTVMLYFIADTDSDGLRDDQEDPDTDTLTNAQEQTYQTNPLAADTDGDGLTDAAEINTHATNPTLTDSDGDTLSDSDELALSTNPLNPDTDGDGLTDGFEHLFSTPSMPLDPTLTDSNTNGIPDAQEDYDADGASTLEEQTAESNPKNPDTDADGLTDGQELHTCHTSPLLPDSDADGLSDSDEVNVYGTNPLSADSDGDSLPDAYEIAYELDPLNALDAARDPDGDGLTTFQEFINLLNPLNPDTDDDGINDGDELGTSSPPPDSDSDGLIDARESNSSDADGDGIPDYLDPDQNPSLCLNTLNPLSFTTSLVFTDYIGTTRLILKDNSQESVTLTDGTSLPVNFFDPEGVRFYVDVNSDGNWIEDSTVDDARAIFRVWQNGDNPTAALMLPYTVGLNNKSYYDPALFIQFVKQQDSTIHPATVSCAGLTIDTHSEPIILACYDAGGQLLGTLVADPQSNPTVGIEFPGRRIGSLSIHSPALLDQTQTIGIAALYFENLTVEIDPSDTLLTVDNKSNSDEAIKIYGSVVQRAVWNTIDDTLQLDPILLGSLPLANASGLKWLRPDRIAISPDGEHAIAGRSFDRIASTGSGVPLGDPSLYVGAEKLYLLQGMSGNPADIQVKSRISFPVLFHGRYYVRATGGIKYFWPHVLAIAFSADGDRAALAFYFHHNVDIYGDNDYHWFQSNLGLLFIDGIQASQQQLAYYIFKHEDSASRFKSTENLSALISDLAFNPLDRDMLFISFASGDALNCSRTRYIKGNLARITSISDYITHFPTSSINLYSSYFNALQLDFFCIYNQYEDPGIATPDAELRALTRLRSIHSLAVNPYDARTLVIAGQQCPRRISPPPPDTLETRFLRNAEHYFVSLFPLPTDDTLYPPLRAGNSIPDNHRLDNAEIVVLNGRANSLGESGSYGIAYSPCQVRFLNDARSIAMTTNIRHGWYTFDSTNSYAITIISNFPSARQGTESQAPHLAPQLDPGPETTIVNLRSLPVGGSQAELSCLNTGPVPSTLAVMPNGSIAVANAALGQPLIMIGGKISVVKDPLNCTTLPIERIVQESVPGQGTAYGVFVTRDEENRHRSFFPLGEVSGAVPSSFFAYPLHHHQASYGEDVVDDAAWHGLDGTSLETGFRGAQFIAAYAPLYTRPPRVQSVLPAPNSVNEIVERVSIRLDSLINPVTLNTTHSVVIYRVDTPTSICVNTSRDVSITFDTEAGHRDIIYTIPGGLPEARYRLVLSSAAIANCCDQHLDGEPEPLIQHQMLSGDGRAGGDFVYDFYVHNESNVHFEDAATTMGVADLGFGCGIAWGDYDGDGWQDLYITNFGNPDNPSLYGDTGTSAVINKLFHNCQGTYFEDVTTVLNLQGPTGLNTTLAPVWADCDNDGDLDLFVSNNGGVDYLYVNQLAQTGSVSFAVQTLNLPLQTTLWGELYDGIGSRVSVWADYDRDGRLDLYIENNGLCASEEDLSGDYAEYPFAGHLYANDGSTPLVFQRWLNAGIRGSGATWVDIDLDRFPDLFCANDDAEFVNYQRIAYTGGLNLIYHNLGLQEFDAELLTSDVLGFTDNENSRGGVWADYDNDGDLDLFVVNSSEDIDAPALCKLYENLWFDPVTPHYQTASFAEMFQDVTEYAGVEADRGAFSASWGDYDNDGWLDLYVSSQLGHNYLYKNVPGQPDPLTGKLRRTFANVETQTGTTNEGKAFAVAWADVDNDGDLDLYVVNHSHPDTNPDDGIQSDAANRLLINSARDHTGARDARNSVLALTLLGGDTPPASGNRCAIGARVTVKCDLNQDGHIEREINDGIANTDPGFGEMLTRVVQGGNGCFGQEPFLLHFGLNAVPMISELNIEWPSPVGTANTHTFTNIAIPSSGFLHMTVKEDEFPLLGIGASDTYDFTQVAIGTLSSTVYDGSTSSAATITIRNDAPSQSLTPCTLTVTLDTQHDEFWLSLGSENQLAHSASFVLGKGEIQNVQLYFAPLTPGLNQTTLFITSNDPAHAQDTSTSMLGEGVPDSDGDGLLDYATRPELNDPDADNDGLDDELEGGDGAPLSQAQDPDLNGLSDAVESLLADRTFSINFQPLTDTQENPIFPPQGFEIDYGEPLSASPGDPYGWNGDFTAYAGCESSLLNPLLDTWIENTTAPLASWIVALPEGKYQLKLTVSDMTDDDDSMLLPEEDFVIREYRSAEVQQIILTQSAAVADVLKQASAIVVVGESGYLRLDLAYNCRIYDLQVFPIVHRAINFQPDPETTHAAVPADFWHDSGEGFTDFLGFGWFTTNDNNGTSLTLPSSRLAETHVAPSNQILDTFVCSDPYQENYWRVRVPVGQYRILVTVGDLLNPRGPHAIGLGEDPTTWLFSGTVEDEETGGSGQPTNITRLLANYIVTDLSDGTSGDLQGFLKLTLGKSDSPAITTLNCLIILDETIDTDNDGLSDYVELLGPDEIENSGDETDPENPDTDGDGILDGIERMYRVPNPLFNSTNPNVTSDFPRTVPYLSCDPLDTDTDDDGVIDGDEWWEDTDQNGLPNPLDPDSDGDGLHDGTESGITSVVDAYQQGDLLPNGNPADRMILGTASANWFSAADSAQPFYDGFTVDGTIQDHPNFYPDADPQTTTDLWARDTDGDHVPDGTFTHAGTLYKGEDRNNNGRNDETIDNIAETDPIDPNAYPTDGLIDSDNDGLGDCLELDLGLDPDDRDTDNDGLTDGDEVNLYYTEPLFPDTDLDGLPDGLEVGITTADIAAYAADVDLDATYLAYRRNQFVESNTFIPDQDTWTRTDPLDTDTNHNALTDGDEDLNANGLLDPGESDPGFGIAGPIDLDYYDPNDPEDELFDEQGTILLFAHSDSLYGEHYQATLAFNFGASPYDQVQLQTTPGNALIIEPQSPARPPLGGEQWGDHLVSVTIRTPGTTFIPATLDVVDTSGNVLVRYYVSLSDIARPPAQGGAGAPVGAKFFISHSLQLMLIADTAITAVELFKDFNLWRASFFATTFLPIGKIGHLGRNVFRLAFKIRSAPCTARLYRVFGTTKVTSIDVLRKLTMHMKGPRAYEYRIVGMAGTGKVKGLKRLLGKKTLRLTPGQFDNYHGIDLIGATDDGIPVIVECGLGKTKRLIKTQRIVEGRIIKGEKMHQMSYEWIADRLNKFGTLNKEVAETYLSRVGVRKDIITRITQGNVDEALVKQFKRIIITPKGTSVRNLNKVGMTWQQVLHNP